MSVGHGELDQISCSGDMGKRSGQNGVPERFFENISRNMIVTEKMLMTNIIGNFVADNIVFGMEVLAHNPEELSLEIWEFTNFNRIS